MAPYEGKHFKTLLLPQIVFEYFQTWTDFFFSGPKTVLLLDFLNFEFTIFHHFYLFIYILIYLFIYLFIYF